MCPHVKCILCVMISDEEGKERFLYQGHCRLHCPREFYPDREQYTCLPCMPNCEICADASVCAKCREGYHLQSGICLTVLCGAGESLFLLNGLTGRFRWQNRALQWWCIFVGQPEVSITRVPSKETYFFLYDKLHRWAQIFWIYLFIFLAVFS